MKTKHTPGPWMADFDGSFVCIDNNAAKMICDIRGWGWLQKLGVDKAIEIQKANAKLIAAAPDLLKALSDYVSYGDSVIAKEAALKAIKKATE